MRLLELVLQGVPGSPGMARAPLGRGVTFLAAGGEGVPVSTLIAHALYDESVEPPAALRAPGAEACRVAVTLQDPGGTTYRVLRDLKTGAAQLVRWNPQSQKFEPVSSRPAEIGQYLRSQVRVPAEDLFRGLFSLRREDAPSRQPAQPPAATMSTGTPPHGTPMSARMTPPHGTAMTLSTPPHGTPLSTPPHGTPSPGGIHGAGMHARMSAAGAAPAGFPGYRGDVAEPAAADTPYAHLSLDEKRRRLAELERTLAAADAIDDVQFELDGLQKRSYQLDEQLAKTGLLEQRERELGERLGRFADLDELPEDFASQVAEYKYLAEQRDRTVGRIESERDSWRERAAVPPAAPTGHPAVYGGVLAGAGALAAALALPDLRVVALAAPVGLGIAAYFIWDWLAEREAWQSAVERSERLGERSRQADAEFQTTTAAVRHAMDRLGVDSPEAVLERFAARESLRLEAQELSRELAALAADAGQQSARAEREEVGARIQVLEAQLAGTGGYGQDPGDMRREIGELKDAIAREERGPSEPPRSPPPPASAPSQQPAAPSDAPPDPTPQLLGHLADHVHAAVHDVVAPVLPRLGQFVRAFTAGRWDRVSIDGPGHLSVGSADGRQAGWAALTREERDLVYFALRLGLIEFAVRKSAAPVIFEEAFADLDAARQAVVRQALPHLASATQVILMSTDPAWQQGAAAVVPLG